MNDVPNAASLSLKMDSSASIRTTTATREDAQMPAEQTTPMRLPDAPGYYWVQFRRARSIPGYPARATAPFVARWVGTFWGCVLEPGDEVITLSARLPEPMHV